MPHLLEEAAQGLLVGLHCRGSQLWGGVDPARTPEPDGGVADSADLSQMPGPGTVSTLQDDRSPLDLVVRPAAASSHLLQNGPLAVAELKQGGAGTSWLTHLYSSCYQA